jgi:hypothetical protein
LRGIRAVATARNGTLPYSPSGLDAVAALVEAELKLRFNLTWPEISAYNRITASYGAWSVV